MPRLTTLRFLTLVMAAAVLVLFSQGCGKKSPPTLKEYEKPGTVTALTATQREDRLRLEWSYGDGKAVRAASFVIERRKTGEDFSVQAETARTDFTQPVTFGVSYTYRVRAKSPRGVLGGEALIEHAALEPPPAPEGFSFAIRPDSVILDWERRTGEDVFFNVYKKARDGDYRLLNPSSLTKGPFADKKITGNEAHYMVRALLMATPPGYEGKGAVLAVMPEDFVPASPLKPVSFSAKSAVVLLWQANPEQWVKGYRVYKKVNGTFSLVGESSIATFSHEGAKSGIYRITALGPVAEGPPSETVEVSPPTGLK